MGDNENNLVKPLRLDKFIKRRAFDLMLFAHIRGLVINFPSISQAEAIRSFCKIYGLDDDEKNINTYLKTYLRMVHELMEMEKSNQ